MPFNTSVSSNIPLTPGCEEMLTKYDGGGDGEDFELESRGGAEATYFQRSLRTNATKKEPTNPSLFLTRKLA